LERLLLQRLEAHLDSGAPRARAPNQFGLRKGISTETAVNMVMGIAAQAAVGPLHDKKLCVLVTLDVRNAFNSLQWPVIDRALAEKATPHYLVHMIRSWLSDRELLVGENSLIKKVTCGVLQGSVLGPTLWNATYDDLLTMDVPAGINLVGFADDLAIVGVASSSQALEDLVNPVLRNIDLWMNGRGLQLAHQKSEAVMLTKKWAFTPPRLSIGGHQIPISKHVRYLGVILDTRLTFAKHVETVAKIASTSATALARLMPNIGGPDQLKRKLLNSVVSSQLLYAAPVWSTATTAAARTRANLVRPQRAAALRVVRAYRTVSDEASLVLADTPTADHLSKERIRLRDRYQRATPPNARAISKASKRAIERKETLEQWQRRWVTSPKAPWTKRQIPDVSRWAGRTLEKIPFTYHMTQAITGHGCF